VTEANQRELAVVQLPHPGGEWGPDPNRNDRGWTDWNHNHARKFLQHSGLSQDERGNVVASPMTFWGEWEGPSSCEPTGSVERGMPAWFQVPRRGDLQSVPRPQNTDPFVFGSFLYSNCQQDHEWPKGSGKYRQFATSRLAVGSVILFGSTRLGAFVLDTCFVVGDVIEIDSVHFVEQVAGRVPEAFVDATLRPIFIDVRERKLSLYLGAQHDTPTASMYSFFPCLPVGNRPVAFPRPELDLEGSLDTFVNPRSSRRFTRRRCTLETARATWTEVRSQVERTGCRLGIFADPL
jgi:hypothetical protein